MFWKVVFSSDAEKDLAHLDRAVRGRIIGKIDWLTEHFDELFPVPLHGEFSDFSKLRAGDWRVFYQIDWPKSRLIIVYIRNRRESYRKP